MGSYYGSRIEYLKKNADTCERELNHKIQHERDTSGFCKVDFVELVKEQVTSMETDSHLIFSKSEAT